MDYEKKIPQEERVYSCFANKGTKKEANKNYFSPVREANISTSKITLLFSLIIATSWGILLVKSFLLTRNLVVTIQWDVVIVLVVGAFTIGLTGLLSRILKSNIDDHTDCGKTNGD